MLHEGILVYKQAYKERDIIAKFLLRSGEIITGYIYGGQGGGKKQKSDILQIGYALRFKVQEFKSASGSSSGAAKTYKISEWTIVWQHEQIRNSYPAFALMNYFCELHQKLSPEFNSLSDEDFGENQFLFNTLSNSLFRLDQDTSLLKEVRRVTLAKLISKLGVFPEVRECLFCTTPLNPTRSFLFYDEGMASCTDCFPEEGEHTGHWLEAGFAGSFQKILSVKYQQCFTPEFLSSIHGFDEEALEKYLWFHFQMKKESFKSLTIL